MQPDQERRRELGLFLRRRREQLRRADYDLPSVGRHRRTGLRREEVAYHAGVSITWYTWLEQGREINPSRQVLDAVAHAMRLSVAEHQYVLSLAGYAQMPPQEIVPTAAAPSHIQRLLDANAASPAFALAPDWGFAGWNRAYEALYPIVAGVPAEDRNLLYLIFTDPSVRRLLPDWEMTSRHFLAEYRAEAGPSLAQPAHVALVTRLRERSPEFDEAWKEHEIKRFSSRERRFLHPEVGELTFEQHRLIPSDHPELHIVIYLPVPGSGTVAKMRRLLGAPPETLPSTDDHLA